MASKTPIKDVFERNQCDLATAVKKSNGWFEKEVASLTKQNITPNKVLGGDPDKLVNKILPGHLYLFGYDPKLKKELPYYDRFPLVFPYAKTPDGFIGLNMHYLSYRFRIVLLDNLLNFKNTQGIDEKTRLRLSWNLLKGISKHRLVEQCVKSYLVDHIQTQIKIISPTGCSEVT